MLPKEHLNYTGVGWEMIFVNNLCNNHICYFGQHRQLLILSEYVLIMNKTIVLALVQTDREDMCQDTVNNVLCMLTVWYFDVWSVLWFTVITLTPDLQTRLSSSESRIEQLETENTGEGCIYTHTHTHTLITYWQILFSCHQRNQRWPSTQLWLITDELDRTTQPSRWDTARSSPTLAMLTIHLQVTYCSSHVHILHTSVVPVFHFLLSLCRFLHSTSQRCLQSPVHCVW